jgi:hypothetical protein
MEHLILKRNKDFGMLFYMGKLICYTIDPHKLTTGLYTLELDYSPKFKATLPHIYNEEIKASRGFRIHVRQHSKG